MYQVWKLAALSLRNTFLPGGYAYAVNLATFDADGLIQFINSQLLSSIADLTAEKIGLELRDLGDANRTAFALADAEGVIYIPEHPPMPDVVPVWRPAGL